MNRRLTLTLSAIALAVGAAVLGTASAATASDYWGIPEYDGGGNYVGCYSPYTGNFFTPAQITEYGCNRDWGQTVEDEENSPFPEVP